MKYLLILILSVFLLSSCSKNALTIVYSKKHTLLPGRPESKITVRYTFTFVAAKNDVLISGLNVQGSTANFKDEEGKIPVLSKGDTAVVTLHVMHNREKSDVLCSGQARVNKQNTVYALQEACGFCSQEQLEGVALFYYYVGGQSKELVLAEFDKVEEVAAP